jgi:hypothetical protein
MWTAEAFEDACAAVPGARVVRCDGIPVMEAPFLEAVRQVAAEAASNQAGGNPSPPA